MVQVNWDEIEENAMEILPEGEYLCRLDEIESDKQTKSHDPLWRLHFTVIAGVSEGSKIFDNLVFSEKGLKRVKYMCSKLGVKVEGSTDLQPSHIMGRRVFIFVNTREHEGKTYQNVPWGGYREFETTGESTPAAGSDIDDFPF